MNRHTCLLYTSDAAAYRAGRYELQSDEIDQFALRAAKQLNLPRVTAVNYQNGFDMEPVTAFVKAHPAQQAVMTDLDAHAQRFMANANAKMRDLPLRDFLVWLNSPAQLNANAAFYSGYVARIGEGKEYPGVELVSSWFDTNLHIYANLLRAIRPTDRTVVLVFGQGHIPLIKSLCESNPALEVVEVADALR